LASHPFWPYQFFFIPIPYHPSWVYIFPFQRPCIPSLWDNPFFFIHIS
jgi:hypothetical protein